MRLSLSSPLLALGTILSGVSAERLLQTTSLNTCQENSQFTASLFNVVFTPANLSVAFDFIGVSNIQGNVTFDVRIDVYGFPLLKKTLDPCTMKDLSGLCPMTAGASIDIPGNIPVAQSAVDQLPGIAYGIPDLDATVKVYINSTSNPGVSLACLEASVSNGQTVDQKGVAWLTAVIAGLALVASAVVSGLGHSNTAAHVASYALALFGYFQATAMVGLVAVQLPPMVTAWTQNFDWTLGIIEIDFMQSIATWYQKATGGTPATLLNTLTTTSVQVQKRSMDMTIKLLEAAHAAVYKRTNNGVNLTGSYVVTGITRVAFKNSMESTNLFLTGLAFFCIFVVLTIIAVAAFKGICEAAVRAGWLNSDKFQDFRNGWLVVLKGIMFRMVLIGYPQMTILCLWELTQIDSPAEVVLAIFFFCGMSATLGWAALKVIRIAKRSQLMHKNPAYILYSDPTALNKWGFLYVQFRATAYYYVLPALVYCVVKGMLIAFGQKSGVAQAVGLLLIEAAALIAASVLKPWMDKKTNMVNIAICSINFLNAIFLMFFCNVFNQPPLATGIMGVLFFLFNALFALVLLIMVFTITIMSLIRKNPDARYQPMTDDRNSFIKSQTQLTTELDALGATARGDKGQFKSGLDLDDDDDSWASESVRRKEAANTALPPSTANSQQHYREPPRSPIDSSVPFFPGETGRPNGPPSYQNQKTAYQGYQDRSADVSPGPFARPGTQGSQGSGGQFRMQNNASQAFRQQNNSSPWQRGAGYDH